MQTSYQYTLMKLQRMARDHRLTISKPFVPSFLQNPYLSVVGSYLWEFSFYHQIWIVVVSGAISMNMSSGSLRELRRVI